MITPIIPPRNPQSISAIVWAACDKLYKASNGKIYRGLVLAACPEYGKGTVSTQYQRWRIYNGLATVRGPRKKGSVKPGPKPKSQKPSRKAAPRKSTAAKKVVRAKKKSTRKTKTT